MIQNGARREARGVLADGTGARLGLARVLLPVTPDGALIDAEPPAEFTVRNGEVFDRGLEAGILEH